MHLIQLLLPLRDNNGADFPPDSYRRVADELTARFGGLTAYTRTPATGLWDKGSGRQRDDVVIYEVMVHAIDEPWWAHYRRELEQRFRQDELVVRAQPMQRL